MLKHFVLALSDASQLAEKGRSCNVYTAVRRQRRFTACYFGTGETILQASEQIIILLARDKNKSCRAAAGAVGELDLAEVAQLEFMRRDLTTLLED